MGTLSRGSIIVQFTEAFMATLPTGQNRVDINLTDGTTYTFYIDNQTPRSPATGDTSEETPVFPWAIAAVVVLAVGTVVLKKRLAK